MVFCTIILSVFACVSVSAASVNPIRYEGNDITDYDPPKGCYWYKLDYTDIPGTYMIKFDKAGQQNKYGPYYFAVTIDSEDGCTKVTRWKSNAPIYGVIVRGGNAYNLYKYSHKSVKSDDNLIAPYDECKRPTDVCHVSVVICPRTFPTKTTTVTTTTTCPRYVTPGICILAIIIAFVFVLIVIFIVFFFPKIWIRCCKPKNKDKRNKDKKKKFHPDLDKELDFKNHDKDC